MDLSEAIARRRMIRAFGPGPLEPGTVDRLLDLARRAPSAGNTGAVRFLVLDTPAAVAGYWGLTLPEPRRSSFAYPGLVAAPCLVVVLVDPEAYVARYAETDKAGTGLGVGVEAWPVPYWWVDAGAVVQNILLLATAAGLGAALFGLFEHERTVLAALDVPSGWRAAATIALGYPRPSPPGRSARRGRPELDEVLRRGRWPR